MARVGAVDAEYADRRRHGSTGKVVTVGDLQKISEVQGLLRTLYDSKINQTTAARLFRHNSRQRDLDDDRSSASLRKRLPICRYQSLPEFRAGETALAQLGDAPSAPRAKTAAALASLKTPKSPKCSSPAYKPRPHRTIREIAEKTAGSCDSWLAANQRDDPLLVGSLLASRSSGPNSGCLLDSLELVASRQQLAAAKAMSRPTSESPKMEQTPVGRQGLDFSLRPPSHYETACARESMVPKFARTAQGASNGGVLDLTGSGLGDRQLTALLRDTALVPLDQIRRWKLGDARLGDSSAALLAEVVRGDVELIDLACNRLTTEGVAALGTMMMRTPLYRLRRLDLSGNTIGDDSLGSLLEGLLMCASLLRLDMNGSAIRDGTKLSTFVAGHVQLTRLSLRRNYLCGDGIAVLFDGILRNSKAGFQLADVDIAWNSIGSSTGSMRAAQAISAVLHESAALYHCDLSYNGMDAASCAVIGEGLRDNHSLYGLHIVGNSATMDADGFLTPLDSSIFTQQLQYRQNPAFGDLTHSQNSLVGESKASVATKRLSVEFESRGSHDAASTQLSRNVQRSIEDDLCGRDASERQTACWACEGWERVELEWPIDPHRPEPRAVWAFTSLDAFRRGLRMKRIPAAGPHTPPRFVAARMVPPGWRLQVVYQVDASICTPPGAKVEIVNPSVDIKLRACQELQALDLPKNMLGMLVEYDGPNPILRVDHAAVIDRTTAQFGRKAAARYLSRRRSVVLDGPDGGPPMAMLRVTETEFKITVKVERGRSFYADFRCEDQNLYRQCFELDWSRCRIGRLIPESELPEVKQVIEAQYGRLIAVYRRYSSVDVSGETELGVSQLQASELIVNAGLGGDNITRIADIDRFFIAAKVTPNDLKKELVVNNDKTLVRYEFLEFLIRIAQQRFHGRGVVDTMPQALRLLLDALEPITTREVDAMEDFFACFHTLDVDDVYKKHQEILDAVYKRNSGSRTLPGRPKTMVLIEFQRLLEALDAYDAEFQSRHSGVAFRMGMMTQRDESGATRFQDMTFLEFQHALGAVIFLKEKFSANQMAQLLDAFFSEKLPAATAASTLEKRRATKVRG